MSEPLGDWLNEYFHKSGFVRRYPYYAAILARLDPINDPGVRVLGVSAHGKRFYLHVNVDYFLRQQNVRFLNGVLIHEVHHIVLGHLGHPKFAEPAHPDLMALAMEMSANEFIREPLPGTPIVWRDYARLGVASGQSTLERYETLVRARLAGLPIPCGGFVDEHLLPGVGHGRETPNELNPMLHHRIEELIAEAITNTTADGSARIAGKSPGDLLTELRGTETPPQRYLDWKTALHVFAGTLRTPVHTYARPNRRFPSQVGVIPGRVFAPGTVEAKSLVVAIDTSGSMSAEELAEIGRHLRLLSDGLRITVVECDWVIQRVYHFRDQLLDVAGRGGTDLRPVFEPSFLRPLRAEGVIYFTDGAGPYPARDPGVRTLWVLPKPSEFACTWGTKAWL
jgi:Uncharacterized protein conserved in bacteria